MGNTATSVLRTLIQFLVGSAVAHFAVGAFAVPKDVQDSIANWAVSMVLAALVTGWTAIVRLLEDRKGASKFDVWCRAIGRILMLGIGSTPVYTAPDSTPPVAPPPATPAPVGE